MGLGWGKGWVRVGVWVGVRARVRVQFVLYDENIRIFSQACLTVPTEEGYEVYATTQWPDQCQQAVALALDIKCNE